MRCDPCDIPSGTNNLITEGTTTDNTILNNNDKTWSALQHKYKQIKSLSLSNEISCCGDLASLTSLSVHNVISGNFNSWTISCVSLTDLSLAVFSGNLLDIRPLLANNKSLTKVFLSSCNRCQSTEVDCVRTHLCEITDWLVALSEHTPKLKSLTLQKYGENDFIEAYHQQFVILFTKCRFIRELDLQMTDLTRHSVVTAIKMCKHLENFDVKFRVSLSQTELKWLCERFNKSVKCNIRTQFLNDIHAY